MQLAHPLIAGRSCDDCVRWHYLEDGTPYYRSDGTRVRRPKGVVTPCGNCPKIPMSIPPAERTPETGRRYEMTLRSRKALRHYQECRAVGTFPDDPLVRRNASILHEIDQACERRQRRQEMELLLAMMGASGAGRRG